MANNTGLWVTLGVAVAAGVGGLIYYESKKTIGGGAADICIASGGTWDISTKTCTCPSGYTLDPTSGKCVTTTPAKIVISSASAVSPVAPGNYAQASIVVKNTGGQTGSTTISGTTSYNGIQQGTWTSQTVTLSAGQSKTVSLQSAGQISQQFAGDMLQLVFTLSTGGTASGNLQVSGSVPSPTAPQPPASVQVTNVQVTGPNDWSATVNCPGSTGATGYKIFDNDQLLGTTTVFPATIHAHAPNQAHDIGVEACN